MYLGATTISDLGSFSISLPVSLAIGQTVTATETDSIGTSAFALALPVTSSLLVTTAADNGDNNNPTPGSLRQAILEADAAASATPEAIAFAIPGAGPLAITLAAALPPISSPVFLAGSSQPGYAGTPIVQIVGQSSLGDGLVLSTGSGGSTISGLDIVGFSAGAAIHIETSGNFVQNCYLGVDVTGTTAGPGDLQGVLIDSDGSDNAIGGNLAVVANVIAFNAGAAVDVDSGTGNQIQGNSIFANGAGIVLNTGNDANDNQPAPTLTAVNSSPDAGTMQIQGTLTGFAAGATFTIDFYASSTGDPSRQGQAHIYLGSASDPITTDSSGDATFSEFLPISVGLSQMVTATATSSGGDTSGFATSVTVGNLFVVTTTVDNGDDSSPPRGSLRQAILAVDANPPGVGAQDEIIFHIPGTAPFIISVLSDDLPAITVPVVLDGTSQPGFDPNNPVPIIEIEDQLPSGTFGPDLGYGLTLGQGSDGSTIEGLDIQGFSTYFPPQDDYLGAGVEVLSNDNTIGGTVTGSGNVLTGNADGIEIAGTGNLVEGNDIGTDSMGTKSLGNVYGVFLDNSLNTIGGTVGAARNVISGNGTGVENIGASGEENLVEGNYIGTDPTGATPLGNSIGVDSFGTFVINGGGLIIGGTVAAARNVISGNGTGIRVTSIVLPELASVLIEGNYIGTDATGMNALANSTGVLLNNGASDVTIGGTADGAGNVISGNTSSGIDLAAAGELEGGILPFGNLILGNDVGTTFDGSTALGNRTGVVIEQGSVYNTIGGSAPDARNVISGNAIAGIDFQGAATSTNLVSGNYVGIDASGKTALSDGTGVLIESGVTNNTIGGTAVGAGNVISGNQVTGVDIFGTSILVLGNEIGTDPTGLTAFANGIGVRIESGASGNTIGGSITGTGNVISGNQVAGVDIAGGSSNFVVGDLIGTDLTRFHPHQQRHRRVDRLSAVEQHDRRDLPADRAT